MTYELPIIAIHKSGETYEYDRLEDLHPVRGAFSVKHVESYCDHAGNTRVTQNDWILRDALGQTVDPEHIPWVARERNKRSRYYDHVRSVAIDRGHAIPGVGRCSARYYRKSTYIAGNRHITAAVADAADLAEIVGDHTAATLAKGTLICGYDRGHRAREKNWKTNRSTRWKA